MTVDYDNTDTTKITVVMTSVTGTNTGGSDVISYNLEWDNGTYGVAFTSIIGYSSNNILLSQTITDLTAGAYY